MMLFMHKRGGHKHK
ncbi:MAG: hypothetical protein Q8P87_00490 [bacterium]|nr:hypothetical protein [bacterium]